MKWKLGLDRGLYGFGFLTTRGPFLGVPITSMCMRESFHCVCSLPSSTKSVVSQGF